MNTVLWNVGNKITRLKWACCSVYQTKNRRKSSKLYEPLHWYDSTERGARKYAPNDTCRGMVALMVDNSTHIVILLIARLQTKLPRLPPAIHGLHQGQKREARTYPYLQLSIWV